MRITEVISNNKDMLREQMKEKSQADTVYSDKLYVDQTKCTEASQSINSA